MIPSYPDLVALARGGEFVQTRFGPSYEQRGEQVRFMAGEMVRRRGLNPRLAWVELLQLLAGTFDPGLLRLAAPRANHSLFTPQMAYGPRVFPQMRSVIEALAADPGTRQAVLLVAKPDDGPTPNLTCTLAIQLMARGKYLHGNVSMRSWDLVKGISYDMVMFGGLVKAVSLCLGLGSGEVTVTAGSAHVYQSDIDRGRDPSPGTDTFYMSGLKDLLSLPRAAPWETYTAIRLWAIEEMRCLSALKDLRGWIPRGIDYYKKEDI